MARFPKCNLHSAEGPAMLQPPLIRNPPCGQSKIAPGVRSLNPMGPGAVSKLVPQAPEGCVLR
eukprot:13328604-Alexandrium_andersonii.AAC.1